MNRIDELKEILERRIVVFDGAMGTMIQAHNLTAEDFGDADLEGCNENLVRTRPDVVLDIHRAYLAAGADVVETNSFGATGLVLREYGLADHAYTINYEAARLAALAANEYSSSSQPRFVAGAIGPTTKAISVTGGVTFPALVENFYRQAAALVDGGADLLLVETCQDTRNIKAALVAIDRLGTERGQQIPVIISGTIETTGTMLAGQTAEAFCASLIHAPLLGLGLNCATGPEFMTDHLRSISQMSPFPVSCYPNAGLPNEEGRYLETPQALAAQMERFVDHGWLNMIGGCCGTTAEHIRALAQMAEGKKPREILNRPRRAYYSGIDLVEAEENARPLIIGERTNVVGSRIFKNLIAEEKWDEATEIARRQVRNGAHIIDVCLESADRDQLRDIPLFYEKLVGKIKAPLMIDTTDPEAVELALTYCQGKSIINSVNLEDGEDKFRKICPIARRYGAALIVGCIDEDPHRAQAFTRERKLAIAQRSVAILTSKYGFAPEDLILDPLVFPCATGDANYIGGAVETIEAIRLVKQHLPHVKTVLGVSNVSFGLPAAAREIVNSVFLYHTTRAGLDLAIVNAEKLERFASIPAEERRLAENLLFNTPPLEMAGAPADWREQTPEQRIAVNQHHIAAITEHFRKTEKRSKADVADLPLDQRLTRYVVEGRRDGLEADLDRKLAEGASAIEIINGPLMSGMSEVGRLFGNNELIVAEVLQSAEAMKAGVTHLEQYMHPSESAARGKILLATVKGDVHDIGKNLVEIILANNGYTVINLGIKVAPEALIEACKLHRPDAIGLSGLLVKSSQQMVATASDFRQAGVRVPLLVGGAALSEKFTRSKIAAAYEGPVYYSKDAMSGLGILNRLRDSEQGQAPNPARPVVAEERHNPLPAPGPPSTTRSSKVRTAIPLLRAPSYERRQRQITDLGEIWSYINPFMLYGRHLGYRGNFESELNKREPKALELFQQMEELKREATGFLKIQTVSQFFDAERDGNSIRLFAPGGTSPVHIFDFDRQRQPEGLCLADYVLGSTGTRRDQIALFVVTAGEGIRDQAEQWKRSGEYFKAHAIQALAVESAEAAVEWLHRRLREEWGFADDPTLTMQQRFTSKYRGKRYSFGYPACPNLDDQQGIWTLLRPEEIGVRLTETMMMDPEASVSGMIFHHPDCEYFSTAI